MGNTKSKQVQRMGVPPLFSKLPSELRLQIWQNVANDWIVPYLDYMVMWTVNGNRICLIYLDTDTRWARDDNGDILFHLGYTLEMPPLLFVSKEARAVMSDALLNFRFSTRGEGGDRGRRNAYQPVPRGEDMQIFLRDSCSQGNPWTLPQLFGWRIQDFRYPGLSDRVKEDKARLKQLEKELMEARQKNIVDPEKAPEGYVRLPLFHPAGSTKTVVEEGRKREIDLYPRLGKTEIRINLRG